MITAMSRVVSKNLFNFELKGVMSPFAKQAMEQMRAMAMSEENGAIIKKMMELALKDDDESQREYLQILRAQMSQFMQLIENAEEFQCGIDTTTTSKIQVPTSHYGDYDVDVHVYTPKVLENQKNRAAFLYAHGGGAIAGRADEFETSLRHTAHTRDLVVFNVDYRLAPETKCPNNIKDFYEVIKYVHTNADSLGIDPNKIVIAGDSGGGYICLGSMVLLAERGEVHMVKLAIPGIPMVDDYCFGDPLCMTVEEREAALPMRSCWEKIADNFEEQKSSPYLFPGKASDEILAKFPPTIINEMEFDMFITEASRLATRLKRVGRLLEFIVIPGHCHTTAFLPKSDGHAILTETFDKIVKEYIHGEIIQIDQDIK